jgi:hypothetical protein
MVAAQSKPGTPGPGRKLEDDPVGPLSYPQAVPIPDIPHDSAVTFEVIMFLYTGAALALQYLNLYRSVWWLPHSYTSQAMNFYLIDPFTILFSVVLLSRRLLWLAIRTSIIHFLPVSPSGRFVIGSKYCTIGLVLLTLGYLSFYVVQQHSLVNILYLLYPASVYFILFGLSAAPFLDLSPPSQGRVKVYRDKAGTFRTNLAAAGGVPTSPELIRMEAAITKTDFNTRLKQVLFNTIISAYYSGFIPVAFCPNFLSYEVWWVSQHTLTTFVGCLTLYLVHCFPAGYNHLLHRTSLHLGHWARMEGRISPNFYNQWSAASLWPGAAIVRHGKDLYKAEGVVNAAEPGNPSHVRYYYLFGDPSLLVCGLLVVQASLVVCQLALLAKSQFWYHLISQGILTFSNYYTLFKLSRDYLILSKVYKAEQMLLERFSPSYQS